MTPTLFFIIQGQCLSAGASASSSSEVCFSSAPAGIATASSRGGGELAEKVGGGSDVGK
uniref:Uncharacterized protein n=1 Tax=Arundo donax TaxID=35708 RepID=A0A0A9B7E3_ARUDO